MFDANEAKAQEILADLDERLDRVVDSTAQATRDHDREFSLVSLGLAVTLMPPGAVADLAFAAVLRLADQKVAAGE